MTLLHEPPVVLYHLDRPIPAELRRKIADLYEQREALELIFYEAEAQWEEAQRRLQDARRLGDVVKIRLARRQSRLRSVPLWRAQSRLFRVADELQSLVRQAG